MKKIFFYNLLSVLIVSNAFAAEDSNLNPRAVSEILGKYSSVINKNAQTKIMTNCVSDYVNKKILDLEHFLHCCNSTIGRDTANLGVCNNMGRDMRAAHNKYQASDANNIAEIGKPCNAVFDKPQTGLFCPENFIFNAKTCTATCNGVTQKWDFKLETCEDGWKVAPNGYTCLVDPAAQARIYQDSQTPRHNGDCDSSKDKPRKNVKCPSDWGDTTSCDLECIAGKWDYSINGCNKGSDIGVNGICVAGMEIGTTRKFHEPCTKEDLPNGATSGWYIKNAKNPDGLGCAAKTCKDNYYLVRNASGASMGWCKYGKDPEQVKKEEAEELARLKAENSGVQMLKPDIQGVQVEAVKPGDINIPGISSQQQQAEERPAHEDIAPLKPDAGVAVKPVSASDVQIRIQDNSEPEVVIKNCKQSDLKALHATAGTERSDGCYVQKCESGYHLELNGRKVTMTDDTPLDKNMKCVKNVEYPTVGKTCPDSKFKDSKYQLPSNATAGKFVKVGNNIVCSATDCGSDYEVVTEGGKGICKKKIAKLPMDTYVQQNDSTYVASPSYQPTLTMPQQQSYSLFNVPVSNQPQAFFKQN